MSLVASAHRARMRKKRANVTSPTDGEPIVSPRNAAGKDRASSPYDAISPAKNTSPVIATLNGVKSQYHVPSDLPPMQMQQQRHVSADQPPMRNATQQQHSPCNPPAYHPPRPPHGRRGAYGGGINSLDTSGDYMVDDHTQWQHPQQQQQQQQRGPSPEYNQNRQTLHHPSPQRQQHSPLRYQGNYTNRPYSCVGAPEDVDEMELHHQQQDQLHQQQQKQLQQQQAFDPFGSSPLTLPDDGLVGNAGDVHSAHRSSPMFQGTFPRQQLSNGMRMNNMDQLNNGMEGSGSGSDLSGMRGMNNHGMGMDNGKYAIDNGKYANDRNNNAHRIPPLDSDNPMLTDIEGNQLDDFVYDPEAEHEDYQDSKEESFTEDGEIYMANGDQTYNDAAEKDIAAFVGSSTAVAYPNQNPPSSYGAQPRPLMNHHDFEYHTEHDEGSTFDGGDEMYNGEGGDAIMPLSFDNQTVADQTMGSDVKRKKGKLKKKRRGHGRAGHGRARVTIDNVNKAEKPTERDESRDPRYATHSLEDDHNSLVEEPEEENDNPQDSYQHSHHQGKSSYLGNSQQGSIASRARRDIVAQARRIASGSDSNSQVSDEPRPSREPGRLPPEMPVSRNWNQNDPFDKRYDTSNFFSRSKSWDSHQDVLSNAKQAGPSFGSFSKKMMWDHDNDNIENDNEDRDSGAQQQRQGNSKVTMRASKSWDDDGGNDSIATWGTWGDQTSSLFGGNGGRGTAGASGSAFGCDKENPFQQQDNPFQQDDVRDAAALAEWAEAEWREKSVVEDVSVKVEEEQQGGLPSSFLDISNDDLVARTKLAPRKPPPLLSPPKTKKKSHGHPWKSSSPTTKNSNLEDEPSYSAGIDVFPESSGAFSEPALVSSSIRFSENVIVSSEEDDDSLFEFDKRGGSQSVVSSIFDFDKRGGRGGSQLGVGAAAAVGVGLAAATATRSSPQAKLAQSNHADISSKINNSLEEAGKTKNRAFGIESGGSNDRSEVEDEEQRLKEEALLLKVVLESPASLMSQGSILSPGTAEKKKNSGRRIAFAEGAPQVHTYLAPEESSIESEYTYDDADDEEENSQIGTTDENGIMEVVAEKITGVSDKARSQQVQPQNLQQEQVRRMSSLSSGTFENDTLGEESDADTFEVSTLGDTTYNDPTKEEEPGGGGDNWALIGNAVTMGMASLGGLFSVAALAASAAPSQAAEEENGGTTDRGGGGGGDRGSTRSLVTEEEERSIETDGDNDTYGESTMQSTQYTGTQYTGRTDDGSEDDWLGYMRNIIFPKDDGATIISGQTLGTKYSGTYDADDSTYQDDEDNYLLQQALAAARAIHHVQGVEYDETQDINVLTDIKFVVVTVSLPLGLLFQEHEIGVWVSRVIPDGNGAKKGVQHGDQLAAINGNSSVHTTIDEVASTISGTPVDIGVELTFLRYVGPLRPVSGSIIQEGFEVTDTTVSPKKKAVAAKSSKRSLFSKMKSGKVKGGDGGTPPSSPGISTRRFASLDISPMSPKRIASSRSSKKTHSSQPSPKSSSASRASSSKASSSKQSPATSALSIPSLPDGGQPQSTKKKKSLVKLLPFKKK